MELYPGTNAPARYLHSLLSGKGQQGVVVHYQAADPPEGEVVAHKLHRQADGNSGFSRGLSIEAVGGVHARR